MRNPIEDKVGNMNMPPIRLFNNMTDEDFVFLHEAGQLKSFCDALSLDLHKKDEKDTYYTA